MCSERGTRGEKYRIAAGMLSLAGLDCVTFLCDQEDMDRRNFLKTGAVAVGLAGASDLLGHTTPSSPIPKRTLGKTGEQLSILGFGGTAVMSIPQSEANSAVAEAL